MSLQETQRKTTSSEFVLWNQFLDDEPNEFNPLFYYLANIAKEIERSNAKHPKRIKTEHKLLKFEKKQPQRTKPVVTDEEKKARLDNSKRFWLGGLGLLNKLKEN